MKDQQRSWLSLVTFCAVTVLVAALGSAALFAGASVAFAVARPAQDQNAKAPVEQTSLQSAVDSTAVGQEISVNPQSGNPQTNEAPGTDAGETFAGMITDARCGAKHKMNSGKTAAECTRSCACNGAHYVLVDGEKVYNLQGEPGELARLAGERE